jgi:hypothetical protein
MLERNFMAPLVVLDTPPDEAAFRSRKCFPASGLPSNAKQELRPDHSSPISTQKNVVDPPPVLQTRKITRDNLVNGRRWDCREPSPQPVVRKALEFVHFSTVFPARAHRLPTARDNPVNGRRQDCRAF